MSQFSMWVYGIALIFLILLSAFFSCAETSLMAVNRYRLRHKARMHDKLASRLLHLLRRPDRVLGTILIGSTFASMFASSLATLLGYHFFGNEGTLLVVFGTALIVLIFGEVTPKTLAALYPDRIARVVYYPIYFFLKIIYPLVVVTNAISNGLLRICRISVSRETLEPLSRDELRTVVYDGARKMPKQYQSMLLSILDLNTLSVNDVMIPHHHIHGIDIDLPWEEMLAVIQKTPNDWLPFYRRDMNHVVGVLFARDVLHLLLTEGKIDKKMLESFFQPPAFVPEGTSLSMQLQHFQKSHEKMAFVVDEYGDMQGLITLDTILEEIVGDFTKGIRYGKQIELQPDGGYLVEGSTTLREFNRITGAELPLKGPRTLNGLIIEQLEALPRVGTTVLIASYPIEIVEVKVNRVTLAHIYPRLNRE